MEQANKRFMRTCQECGYKQESKDPSTYANDSWRDIKCKKCKSIGLDYGTYVYTTDSYEGNQHNDFH